MVNAIINFFANALGLVVQVIVQIVQAYLAGMLFRIAQVFFTLLDFFQSIFRKLAGLEDLTVAGNKTNIAEGEDVVFRLLALDYVKNALIALSILAVALLFLATFIQMIRVEYNEDGAKNSKWPIITTAFKSLTMFVVVPVSCIFGVALSNFILSAVDDVTTGGNNTSVAGMVFKVGAFDANILRTGEYIIPVPNSPFISEWVVQLISGVAFHDASYATVGDSRGPNGYYEFENSEDYRCLGFVSQPTPNELDDLFAMPDSDAKTAENYFGNPVSLTAVLQGQKVNYNCYNAVRYYYQLKDFNFIIAFVAGAVALVSLFNASTGMIMRIYNIILLFIISPPICAIMPLDGGNAYKSWRQKFIGNVLGAYGTIVSFNILFQIMHIIQNVDLFEAEEGFGGGTSWDVNVDFFNRIAQTLFVIVGCLMLKDSSKLISGLIGAEDAMASGEGMNKQIAEKAKKVGKVAVAGAALATGAGFALASKFSAGAAKSEGFKSDEANEDIGGDDAGGSKKGKISKAFSNVKNAPSKFASSLGAKFAQKGKKGGSGGSDSSGGSGGGPIDKSAGGSADDKSKKSGKRKSSNGGSSGSSASEDSSASNNSEDDNKSATAKEQGSTNEPSNDVESAEKWAKRVERNRVRSQRAFALSKNIGISMIASSGIGKSLNEMTGGAFKVLGGKGVNQWDGEIASKSDLDAEVVQHYSKEVKKKKEQRRNESMGEVYEVLSAQNQKIVRDSLMRDNAQAIMNNSTPDMRIANLTELARILQATSDNTSERQNALDNFSEALKNSGFANYNGIAKQAIDSDVEFKLSADGGAIECHSIVDNDVTVFDKASVDAFKNAVKEALSTATSSVRADDAKTAWDGLVDSLNRGLSKNDKKQLGAQSLHQLNASYYGASSTEKRDRADMKEIISILRSKL